MDEKTKNEKISIVNQWIDRLGSAARMKASKYNVLREIWKSVAVPSVMYVVSANSVITFESRLDNFWKDQDQKFNYKAKINNTTRSQQSQLNISIQAAIANPQAL